MAISVTRAVLYDCKGTWVCVLAILIDVVFLVSTDKMRMRLNEWQSKARLRVYTKEHP